MSDSSRSDGRFAWVQAIAGWVTLGIVLLSVIPLGANRPVVWTLLGLAVVGLFGVQVVLSLLRPTAVALGRAMPWLFAYFVVLLWGMVQVALPAPEGLAHPVWALAPEGAVPRIGADPGQGRHIVLRLATYGMVAWIMAASALSSRRAWAYLRAIALFSTALAIYGLYAAITGTNPILGIDSGQPTVVSATFVNRNSYATYGAFGLMINVVLYMQQAGRGASEDHRVALRNFLENFFAGAWIYALGALLCAAAVALTASRAGGVSAVLGLIVLFLALSKGGRASSIGLWAVLAAIVGFVLFALTSDTIDRFLASSGEGLRFVVFPVVFQHIFDRPWLGQGIGAFQDTFRAFVPLKAAEGEWDMAHNSYLENFYELGIPAAMLLYLALAGVLLRLLAGLRTRSQDLGVPAAALACLTTAGVHAMFDFSLQMPACAALFAAILGIGWAQSFARKDRAVLRPSEANNDI